MADLIFHEVEVDHTVPVRDAATRLREFGFAVTGDYDEEHRFLKQEPVGAASVKVAFARLTEPINVSGAFERYAEEKRVRFATLRETAALAAKHPELFTEKSDAPIVVMDPLTIAGDRETWVPVFPADAPDALCVEPVGNEWGPVRFPVVQL
jgi:hypothetical protein